MSCDLLNRGTLLERIPDKVQSGQVVWGPNFPVTGGTSGSNGFTGHNSFFIVQQEGPDAEIKQKAAFEFIKEWMKRRQHAGLRPDPRALRQKGPVAAARGRRPTISSRPRSTTIGEKPGIWSGHPRAVDFQYNLLAPHGQRMLQGAPVKDELAAYADEVDKVLAG